jgi:RNA-directed DNA polymerase
MEQDADSIPSGGRQHGSRVKNEWLRGVLVRRSQRAQVGWARLNPLLARWIPQPRVLHSYPDKRFDAIHPG